MYCIVFIFVVILCEWCDEFYGVYDCVYILWFEDVRVYIVDRGYIIEI